MGRFCYINNLANTSFGACSQGIFGNFTSMNFQLNPFNSFSFGGFNGSNFGFNSMSNLNFGSIWNNNFNSNNFVPNNTLNANFNSSNFGLNNVPSTNFNNAAISPPIFNVNIPQIQLNPSISNMSNMGDSANSTLTGTKDLAFWKSQGYDENMGRRLAQDAVSTCKGRADGGCVGYTRRTINRIYGTNFANAGAAENFGRKILSSSQLAGKFKMFKINGINGNEVPDGAILIWPHTAYRSGKAAQFGHGGIASGGKVYSDCVCRDLSKCCEIWIPVKA